MRYKLYSLVILWLSLPSYAETAADTEMTSKTSYFAATDPDAEDRGDLWRPTLSLFLPGLDQISAGHYKMGLSYFALHTGANAWASDIQRRLDKFESSDEFRSLSDEELENIQNHRPIYQEWSIANQLSLVASGMSAYHAFRTSVESRRHRGQYQFLDPAHEETPLDIALAPFNFSYLTRSTSYTPLAALAIVAFLSKQSPPEGFRNDPITWSDSGYTLAQSYNAGTNEEAIFRGWIMPYARQYSGSYFVANTIQSGLFAAAHLNQNNVPIFQLALGYFLGWLTKENNWTLGESIFIHTWWDVLAFGLQYSTKKEAAQIMLPGLQLAF